MSATKLAELQKAALAFTATAREVAEKAQAENRPFTDDEKAEYDDSMAKARGLADQINTVRADMKILADAKALSEQIGLPVDDIDAQAQAKNDDYKGRLKSLGFQVTNSLEFKAALEPYIKAGRVPEKARIQTDPINVKGLFVGGDSSSAGAFVVPEQSGIVETLGRRELTIRDLVSVRQTGSDAIEFVRQVSHTNAAAVVPEATTSAPIDGTTVTAVAGGRKPEGD